MPQLEEKHLARAIATAAWIGSNDNKEPRYVEQTDPPVTDRRYQTRADLAGGYVTFDLEESGSLRAKVELNSGQGYIEINNVQKFLVRWSGGTIKAEQVNVSSGDFTLSNGIIRGYISGNEVTLNKADGGLDDNYSFTFTKIEEN